MVGKRRITLAGVATAVLMLALNVGAQSAPKNNLVTVHLRNESRYDAWVDLSSSRGDNPAWTIRRSLCMKPGETATEPNVPIVAEGIIDFSIDYELRVRAELKRGDCRSGNVKTVWSKISFGSDTGPHDAYGRITDTTVVLSHKPL